MRHLDTNIVIAYFNGNLGIATRLQALDEVAISAISVAELIYGIKNSSKPVGNLHSLTEFLKAASVVPFDQRCADVYGTIRLGLKRKGRPTGSLDLLIAATALAHDAILVTHNNKHFENIEGLKLEDWLA